MSHIRHRIAALLSLLALEGILITDPVRPWLPFSIWTFDTSAISAAGILAFAALAIIGAFLPFTFPGLKPLPATFPLIGACLILYGLPPAAALATATIMLSHWRRDCENPAFPQETRFNWLPSLAGMGLGLLIADMSGYVLPADPASRGSLSLAAAVTVAVFMSGGAAIASIAARYFASDEPPREASPTDWVWILVAAPIAAWLSLAVAQSVRIWGLGPVTLWLAVPFAAMSPLVVAFARQRRAAQIHVERAERTMAILEALALAIEA